MKSFSDQIGAFTRKLQDAQEAAAALPQEIAVSFDPNDPISVDKAILDLREEISRKAAPYADNEVAAALFESVRQSFEQDILQKVTMVKRKTIGNGESAMHDQDINQKLRDIENTIYDLRRADFKGFLRFVKKLHRQLTADELKSLTSNLKMKVNFEEWVHAGLETQGGMVGSAHLDWPDDQEQEFGLVIALTEAFAVSEDALFEPEQFSYQFYYQANDFNQNVRHMVEEVYVPFGRDFVEYVKRQTSIESVGFQQRPEVDVSVRKVFIVHGHDNATKQEVARFLERMDFEPVILHEQANRGLTIIEKIEAYDKVGFAVVLLTPDDVGSNKDDTAKLKPRARQNVIAELGYFVARLGRPRVVALKRGDVEVPSDFDGVLYIPIDSGDGWKLGLANELDAVGYEIDFNKVMGRRK